MPWQLADALGSRDAAKARREECIRLRKQAMRILQQDSGQGQEDQTRLGRRITIKYVDAPVAKKQWHTLRDLSM